MSDGELILVGGSLLAAGLLASLLASRLRVPSLVLFLGLGMLIGSDGAGWIRFNDYELARTIGVIGLALILFEGGLTAGPLEIRPVLPWAISLAVVGTIATAVIAGLAAAWLFDFSTLEGLLVGSIVATTDGAAIFALLRGSTLRRRLATTLEAESGLNDPVAVLLVLGFIDWIEQPGYGLADMVLLFGRQIGIGILVGAVVGIGGGYAFRRLHLATAGLYPVASLALAALAYGGADSIEGSGFLAVYLTGLALGEGTIPAKRTVTTFHQGLAWVAQVVMFLTLGLLVFPGQLADIALEGTVLALVVVFAARPLGAALATAPGPFTIAERIVLGWAGLRGALPVVLATFPVIAGIPGSLDFFNIAFFAVVLSTILQGSTFEPLARWLRTTTSQPALPAPLFEPGMIRRLGADVLEYPIDENDAIVGRRVRDLGLPDDALVNVVIRGEEAIPPRGSTMLHAGDRLHLLVRQERSGELEVLRERWRTGPIGPPPRPSLRGRGGTPTLSVRPWKTSDGSADNPSQIEGQEVIDRLRVRRDLPGSLLLLADGRYAITGPVLAVGSRAAISEWARRRLAIAGAEERAWLQRVIGTLSADVARQ